MTIEYQKLRQFVSIFPDLLSSERSKCSPEALKIFLEEVTKEEFDFLFQLITVLLNSSDHVSSPAAKFRLLFLLKTIALYGKSRRNFIESLVIQDSLIQTLVRITLFQKEIPFPQKGQGFFTSWPQSQVEMQHNTAIANNLIGLSLELLKYFGESEPHSIFGVIFNELVKKFDYKYPSSKVYSDKLSIIKRREPSFKKGECQASKICSYFEEEEMKNVQEEKKNTENEAQETIRNLERKLASLSQIVRELSTNTFNEGIQMILLKLVDCQMVGKKIKSLLNGFPLLETCKKGADLCFKAAELLQLADNYVQEYFVSVMKEEKEYLKSLQIHFRFNVEDEIKQKEHNEVNQNDEKGDANNKPNPSGKKPERNPNKKLKITFIDEDLMNDAQQPRRPEEENKKVEMPQSFPSLPSHYGSHYKIINPLLESIESLPSEFYTKYWQWNKVAHNTEWSIYQGVLKQNEQLKVIGIVNKNKLPSEKTLIEFNHEVRYRKMVKHEKVAPLLEFGKPPQSDLLWFVELQKRTIDSTSFNNYNFDFISFFREMVQFMIDLRNDYGLIFENLTSADILIDGKKKLTVKNWFKVTEYVSEKQEWKALESIGKCIVELVGENKKLNLYKEPSKLVDGSKILKNIFLDGTDSRLIETNFAILTKCVEAVERKITFEILDSQIRVPVQEVSNLDSIKAATFPHLLVFDQQNQRVGIFNEKQSPVIFSFKDKVGN